MLLRCVWPSSSQVRLLPGCGGFSDYAAGRFQMLFEVLLSLKMSVLVSGVSGWMLGCCVARPQGPVLVRVSNSGNGLGLLVGAGG